MSSIKSSFNSLSSIASSAYSWGSDICSQMAAGVRAAAGSVVRAAENVASKVRSLLHFSVPDTGPLSDADEYMPDFMKLLASGIKKNQDKVVMAVKTLSGSMKTNLNTPVGDMGDKVKSVVSGFATTISGSTTRVRSAASGLASGIRTGLMSGLEGMTSEFQSVWSDLEKITKTSVSSMI